MEADARGPIFIGGPDRCGKTTLQAFLASHPNIAIPAVGSNLWSYFYRQYGDLSRANNFERCLDALQHYKHAIFLNPDVDRIRREFWAGAPTYERLFALLHEHFAERLGKRRWGDQTGLIERYADEIFRSYPGAKMIHMLRDPRDRYEASLAMWPKGKGRAGAAAARWVYSARLAQRNEKRYPDRYRIVHFEHLILYPEQTLRGLCEFLQEDFVEDMLRMEGSPGHREKLQQSNPGEAGQIPLSAEFIGRYSGRLSDFEVAFIQSSCRSEIEQFGYPAAPISFSGREWIRYSLVFYPLNGLRMSGWLFSEAASQNLPGVVGRKPSSHMVVRSARAKQVLVEKEG
jgi:hypothetical protein